MEDSEPRRCCLCIPRDFRVKLMFFWLCLGFVMMINLIMGYGEKDDRAYIAMGPIPLIILVNICNMFMVFFMPGRDTPEGRYRVFALWFWGIFVIWNAYYYFLLFNDVWVNVQDFECAVKFPKTSNDYKNCLEPQKEEFFRGTFFFLILDIYFAWELYRWQRDA